MNLTRISAEFEEARKHFDYIERHPTQEGTVFVMAALQTTSGHIYTLSVSFPESYPNTMPSVYIRKPTLASGSPHVYREGNICYLHPSMWNPGQHNLTFVLARAAKWLNKYDVWQRTRNWPGAQIKH